MSNYTKKLEGKELEDYLAERKAKNTPQVVEVCKPEDMEKLQNEVESIIKEHVTDYDDPDRFFNDLQQGGCASGLIGELIYYKDTVAFFNRHADAINQLFSLVDMQPTQLKGWDNSDPLALETNNRNILAWFAFEEIAYTVQSNLVATNES